jgi:hypothetical protein
VALRGDQGPGVLEVGVRQPVEAAWTSKRLGRSRRTAGTARTWLGPGGATCRWPLHRRTRPWREVARQLVPVGAALALIAGALLVGSQVLLYLGILALCAIGVLYAVAHSAD